MFIPKKKKLKKKKKKKKTKFIRTLIVTLFKEVDKDQKLFFFKSKNLSEWIYWKI